MEGSTAMAADDEIRALRARLDQLQRDLGEAQDALRRLELRGEVVPAPPLPAEPAAPTPILSTPAVPPRKLPPPLPPRPTAQAITGEEVPAPATVPPPLVPTAQAARQATPPPVPAKPRRTWGPPPDMNFEMALGTWWLPRIGIAILSLGVVYLVTLAAQWLSSSWFMPYLRIGGGYLVCVALLVAAKRLEHSARGYARVLASGGFALSYFVTFAAHFISDPPVIPSQILTGLLLFGVVLAWGVVAQRRQSRLLALGVTLLGHFTIFLSLKSADAAQLFSLPALFLFSLGSAFFLVKNRWYSVGAAGMLCSHLNLAVLLEQQVFVSHNLGTIPAVLIVGALYAIYALAELFAPESLRRRDIRLSLRSAYVTANTGAALLLGLLLWNRAGMADLPPVYVLYTGLGAVVFVIARLYYHVRAGDPLYNIYQVKAISLLTIALAHYLDGYQLAVALAVEALVLLLNAASTGFVVSRVGALVAAVLSTGLLMTTFGRDDFGADPTPMWLVFGLLHAAGLLYLKVDWRSRSLRAEQVHPRWHTILKPCDLLDLPPDSGPFVIRLAGELRVAWPLIFSLLASVGWVQWATEIQEPLTNTDAVRFWALLGLATVAVIGVATRAWNMTQIAPFLMVVAVFGFRDTWREMRPGLFEPKDLILLNVLIGLGLSELARLSAPRFPELWPRILWQPRGSAQVFGLMGAVLLCGYFDIRGGQSEYSLLYGSFALGFAVYTAVFNTTFWSGAGLLLYFAAVYAERGNTWALVPMLGVVLLTQCTLLPERPGILKLRRLPLALWCAAMLWVAIFDLQPYLPEPWTRLDLALVGGAALLGLRWMNPHVVALWVLASAIAGAATLIPDRALLHDTPWTLALAGCAVLALVAGRVFATTGRWPLLRLHDLSAIVGYLIGLVLLEEQVINPWEVTTWFALSLIFLAYAVQGRLYLSIGVALLVAAATTLRAAQGDVPLFGHTLLGPLASTGAAMLFWAACEWGLRRAGPRQSTPERQDQARYVAQLLALLACGLGLLALYQIDLLANLYLTIAWTGAAVAMMLVGALSAQPYYRYGGLITFALVIGRAALWDTRNLDPVIRVVTMMLLGAVLLAVAYGYIRARAKAKGE